MQIATVINVGPAFGNLEFRRVTTYVCVRKERREEDCLLNLGCALHTGPLTGVQQVLE